MPRRECIDKLFDEVSVIACLIKLNIKDLKDSIQKEQRTKGGFTGEQKAMVNAIRDGYKKAKDVAELLSGLDVGKATAEQLSVITFNDFCVNRVMELMPETEAEFEKYISEQRALRYSSGRKKEKVRV